MHTATTPTPAAPKLRKERMRYTRLFVLATSLLIIFGTSIIPSDSGLHETLELIGYAFVAVCALGRLYCTGFIGGLKNETVIDSGPFSIVRNPLYVFSFIGVVGIGLQSGMVTVFLLLVGGFLLYYPKVVAQEEAFLAHKFGVDYQHYCARVPRWIPRFSLWKEPEEITLRPKFLRNAFMDSLVFFLPLPIFEAIESLHHMGYIDFLRHIP